MANDDVAEEVGEWMKRAQSAEHVLLRMANAFDAALAAENIEKSDERAVMLAVTCLAVHFTQQAVKLGGPVVTKTAIEFWQERGKQLNDALKDLRGL